MAGKRIVILGAGFGGITAALELRRALAADHQITLVDRRGTHLTELAARAGITKQAMMQVLDDLESAGYLRRHPDPRDARAKVVRLTARGVRERAEARRAISGVDARVRRHLGGRRYDTLREALESLATPEG